MGAVRRRRAAVATICLVLLTGACSSTNRAADTVAGASQEGATASSGPAATASGGAGTSASNAATASGTTGAGAGAPGGGTSAQAQPGMKPITSPIEIGFVQTAVSNAAQFGINVGDLQTVSENKVNEALVRSYNKRGGIAGRKIVPIYADTDTASNRWDADFAAACAKFTQDHHVEAVLGYVFDFQPALEDCLAKKNIPHLTTTFNVPDAVAMARYPLFIALSTPRIERRSLLKLEGAMRDRVLTKTTRFGVMMDGCPQTVRSWDETVLPYIKSKGLKLVAAERFSCASGASDNSRAIRDVQSAILKLRAADAGVVMIHGVSEGPALLLFSHEANSQGYSPTYIVSSLANAAVLQSQLPPNQARNFHGYGWLPAQDVPPSKWPAVSSAGKRCIDMVKAEGVQPSTAQDYSLVLNVCDALFIYERALKTNAGRSDGIPIIRTVEGVGTSFVSAINLEGKSTITRTIHDAPTRYRHFAWDDAGDCFTYRGASWPIR